MASSRDNKPSISVNGHITPCGSKSNSASEFDAQITPMEHSIKTDVVGGGERILERTALEQLKQGHFSSVESEQQKTALAVGVHPYKGERVMFPGEGSIPSTSWKVLTISERVSGIESPSEGHKLRESPVKDFEEEETRPKSDVVRSTISSEIMRSQLITAEDVIVPQTIKQQPSEGQTSRQGRRRQLRRQYPKPDNPLLQLNETLKKMQKKEQNMQEDIKAVQQILYQKQQVELHQRQQRNLQEINVQNPHHGRRLPHEKQEMNQLHQHQRQELNLLRKNHCQRMHFLRQHQQKNIHILHRHQQELVPLAVSERVGFPLPASETRDEPAAEATREVSSAAQHEQYCD